MHGPSKRAQEAHLRARITHTQKIRPQYSLSIAEREHDFRAVTRPILHEQGLRPMALANVYVNLFVTLTHAYVHMHTTSIAYEIDLALRYARTTCIQTLLLSLSSLLRECREKAVTMHLCESGERDQKKKKTRHRHGIQ